MTRGKFVLRDGKFVPYERNAKAERSEFIGDEIPPTQHPKSGRIFTSRKKFKDETKAYGLEECYGEPDKYWDRPEQNKDEEIREDIEISLAKLSYGEALTYEETELCKLRDTMMDKES